MNRILLFVTFLVLGLNVSFAQKSIPLSDLKQNLRKAQSDTARVSALIKIADYYYDGCAKIINKTWSDSVSLYTQKAIALGTKINYQKGVGRAYLINSAVAYQNMQDDLAEKYARKGIEILKKYGNKTDQGDSYHALMLAISVTHPIPDAIAAGQKARQLYLEGNDKNSAANVMADIAWHMMMNGDYKQAIEILEKSVQLKKSAKKQDFQNAYAMLTLIYNETSDTKKALYYGLKGVAIVDKLNDQSQVAAAVYNNVAMVYQTLKNGNESIKYFEKAYAIAKQYDDISTTTLMQSNIIGAFFKARRNQEALPYMQDMEKNFNGLSLTDQIPAMGCLIHAYVMLKQPQRAEKYAKMAMAISKKLPEDDEFQKYLYGAIQDYYFEIKQFDQARVYLLKYKKFGKDRGSKKKLEESYKQLARIDSAQGNLASAMANFKLYHKYRDSLYNEKKNKEIAELQVKFNTEEKDKNLLLLKKQGELQQTKLSQANLMRNVSIAGILILLIAIGLVVRRFRINQRIRKEIDGQNSALQNLLHEKEWLIKEVHHRVKNNLQIVMSLLNTQSHFLEDNAALAAIRNSQHRIHSMSLIHKKLYQSESVISIDMELYIRELVEYFKQSFDTGQRIRFITQVEPIELDTTRAVPLGLILNEAIINAIKHAFPDGREGTISIALKAIGQNEILLSIQDDGVGLADYSAGKEFSSLGMKLIKGFSGELNADLEFKNDNGLHISLVFAYNNKLVHQQQMKVFA